MVKQELNQVNRVSDSLLGNLNTMTSVFSGNMYNGYSYTKCLLGMSVLCRKDNPFQGSLLDVGNNLY